ncbi:hypothetical protein SAMN05216503_3369 [Polaribacter sp. KT25b]|nr:hypothetical protein SAMN05216503_3369 [Polaribacter sp. KT25b]
MLIVLIIKVSSSLAGENVISDNIENYEKANNVL